MAASQSVEYATLVQCTEKLARGISQDPLSMANKLLEAGLVPPTLVSKMLLPSGENYSKATELVLQVIKVVAGFPQKFHVFMKILKDCYWLNDLAETVCGQYEVTKKDQDEVIQVKANDSRTPDDSMTTTYFGLTTPQNATSCAYCYHLPPQW